MERASFWEKEIEVDPSILMDDGSTSLRSPEALIPFDSLSRKFDYTNPFQLTIDRT